MNNKLIGIIVAVLAVFGITYFIANRDNQTTPTNQTTSSPANTQTNGVTIDLSGQQLTSFPENLLNRTDVKVLNLSNNQLTSLPASLSSLTNLEVLNIENNRLISLPSEISELKNLREILANNNRITGLPNELGSMTWLKIMDISGNNIPASEINQIKSKLPNTQVKT